MNKKYSYIGVALVILLFGIYVIRNVDRRFEKRELVKFNRVPAFEMVSHRGDTISNKDYEGKVFVVEFFFSTCPTICPIMKTKMLALQDEFYGNPEFGIASFSITPKIDTPEILKEYAKNGNITLKNWHLLTGKPESYIYDLSNTGFKLPAGKGGTDHGGLYHSGNFALVDKDGYIRSRKDENGNPIFVYRALDEYELKNQIQELKEDIKLLLDE